MGMAGLLKRLLTIYVLMADFVTVLLSYHNEKFRIVLCLDSLLRFTGLEGVCREIWVFDGVVDSVFREWS